MNVKKAMKRIWTVAGKKNVKADDIREAVAAAVAAIQLEGRTPDSVEHDLLEGWLLVAEGRD